MEIYQEHDPARGPFVPWPASRQGTHRPVPSTEHNPYGVMRPGKTRDDRLPVGQRQRVAAWRKRSGR